MGIDPLTTLLLLLFFPSLSLYCIFFLCSSESIWRRFDSVVVSSSAVIRPPPLLSVVGSLTIPVAAWPSIGLFQPVVQQSVRFLSGCFGHSGRSAVGSLPAISVTVFVGSASSAPSVFSGLFRTVFRPLVLCPSGRFGHCSAADKSPHPVLVRLLFGCLSGGLF